ncbi:origin recognition complex subunit 3-like [Actinia tenebrosa]|uniref:Origin recognition complex subunit 3 n=1 Tax=Actinia tenebrosa TaxID=6105 RepID=A0A6P8ILK1_ACTTE|nr:origin recognition complex subunit 3-like [Actinia tenebrosa]
MAEETTSSVSKGCFLFKKNVTGSPRKRRYGNAIDLIDRYDGESTENVSQRYDNFKQCWKQVKTKIEALESNSKIFSHIVEYVQSAHKKSNKTYKHGYINEIPTAVLITGVNMPDHDIIFSQLAKDLSKITPYIAVLQSKDCTTMKFTMKNMVLQFMSSDEEDEEKEESHGSVHHKPRLGSYTMVQLCHWYKTACKIQESEKKNLIKNKETLKKSSATENPPLVVILEDFEGFHPPVIQDFVSVCSQYTHDIPLVMVFGVATSVSAVHQVLPHSVSTLLSIERFQSQPSLTCLLEIISKVLMTAGIPFKLGHKVFRFLYENFLFHDFSLQNFSTGLQFCMMEHFYENPVSVVCCKQEERESVITDLSHEELEIMRRRPSFRKYVESCEMKEQVFLLSDDDHTKDVIIKLLVKFDCYHKYFFPVLDCLHAITANLPKHLLGKRVRDVYELCLNSNIYEQEQYKESLSLLRVYAKDELLLLLQKCVVILTSSLKESCKELENHRDKLTSFLEQFEKIGEVKQTEETTTPVEPKVTTPKILSRFELQEKLKTAAKQKRKDSPFDQLRQEVVEYLNQFFREYLTCPQNMPLHEVMYFDGITAVKQHLIGMPRVAIQTALTNPHHYLKCECCEIDAGTIQDSLPDISIAYKLHLECGRLINLYDWLQAFSVVIDPDSCSSKKKTPAKKKKKSNEELQARFIRAVSELQFIGFIKPTKRKTDHVQRLTWGGC